MGALEDVCHQDNPSSMRQRTVESGCMDQNQSALEAVAVKSEFSDISESNSSRQPTIVNQLMKDDEAGCSKEDTMQADHLLEVFNWQVAGAICATVLGSSIEQATRERDELELLITRRLEEESKSFCLPSTKELKLTPKIMWIMRQLVAEWAESDQKEQNMKTTESAESNTVVR